MQCPRVKNQASPSMNSFCPDSIMNPLTFLLNCKERECTFGKAHFNLRCNMLYSAFYEYSQTDVHHFKNLQIFYYYFYTQVGNLQNMSPWLFWNFLLLWYRKEIKQKQNIIDNEIISSFGLRAFYKLPLTTRHPASKAERLVVGTYRQKATLSVSCSRGRETMGPTWRRTWHVHKYDDDDGGAEVHYVPYLFIRWSPVPCTRALTMQWSREFGIRIFLSHIVGMPARAFSNNK